MLGVEVYDIYSLGAQRVLKAAILEVGENIIKVLLNRYKSVKALQNGRTKSYWASVYKYSSMI